MEAGSPAVHLRLEISSFALHGEHVCTSRDAGEEDGCENCGGFLFATIIVK